MKVQYKAVICDVDGTLIPNKQDGMPSIRVRQAIEKAQHKVHIGIATARSLTQLKHLFQEISFSAPCIITGGAQIINPQTHTYYSEKILDSHVIEEVVRIANKMQLFLIMADSTGEFVFKKHMTYKKPFDLYTEAISEETAKELLKNLAHLKDTAALHTTTSWEEGKVHITISNPEATKQHGILEVANILGIDTQEIIGIGEGQNDFPLLMACGLKVAMGNAEENLKAIADYIAPSVEQDGVADVIEKFIL